MIQSDAARRILQLEREVQTLTESLRRIEKQRVIVPRPGTRLAVLEAVDLIDGRAKTGDSYTTDEGDAILLFMSRDGTTGGISLDPVQDSATTKRIVNLINLAEAAIPGGQLALGYSDGADFYCLDGGGGDARLYRFALQGGFTAGVAASDINQMNGTLVTDAGEVEDPEGIFSTLGTGDTGLCMLQDGVYYIIQAGCPAA